MQMWLIKRQKWHIGTQKNKSSVKYKRVNTTNMYKEKDDMNVKEKLIKIFTQCKKSMAKKLTVLTMILLCGLYGVQTIVYGAEGFSGTSTYEISGGDGWHNHNDRGEMFGQEKTSSSARVEVVTLAKTMSSYPEFRIVNSNEKARSDVMVTKDRGGITTSYSNTANKGDICYASIKPSWRQMTKNRTIKIAFCCY